MNDLRVMLESLVSESQSETMNQLTFLIYFYWALSVSHDRVKTKQKWDRSIAPIHPRVRPSWLAHQNDNSSHQPTIRYKWVHSFCYNYQAWLAYSSFPHLSTSQAIAARFLLKSRNIVILLLGHQISRFLATFSSLFGSNPVIKNTNINLMMITLKYHAEFCICKKCI